MWNTTPRITECECPATCLCEFYSGSDIDFLITFRYVPICGILIKITIYWLQFHLMFMFGRIVASSGNQQKLIHKRRVVCQHVSFSPLKLISGEGPLGTCWQTMMIETRCRARRPAEADEISKHFPVQWRFKNKLQ